MADVPQIVETAPPNCPITGLPAMRHIQNISTAVLVALWRVSFGVRVAGELSRVRRFGLWEAPCGLAFFHPMIAGGSAFYNDFYGRLGTDGPWSDSLGDRSDYQRVAAFVRPGDRVLDVGCGPAGFARHIPLAHYVGLDHNIKVHDPAADVRPDTIDEHAQTNAGMYDVVCAFHVVEHVAEPASFVAAMVRCLRPDGCLAVAVPSWPSALTDVPNFVINGPPHHLTWWTEGALRALADKLGLTVEVVEALPPSPASGIAYWMGRAAPKLTGNRFFRHAWGWHLALLWSWLAGRLGHALFRLPARPHKFELLLVARKTK